MNDNCGWIGETEEVKVADAWMGVIMITGVKEIENESKRKTEKRCKSEGMV